MSKAQGIGEGVMMESSFQFHSLSDSREITPTFSFLHLGR